MMSQLSDRGYQGKKDFPILIDLIARFRPPEHRLDFPNKVDLEEAFASATVRKNARLWFEDDVLVGWAYVDEYNNLIWEMDNRYEGLIGKEIIQWGELCVRRSLPKERTGLLQANCRADHTSRMAFLQRHGFRKLEETTVTLRCELSDPLPEPELPAGFVVRSVTGKEEAAAVAAMHRAALGTEYMTTENRLIIMSTREYDPSLDLVVVAPDGQIVANCICSVNPQERVGFTDPISTHPEFQRLGLARALLLTGLKLLKERGMTYARLGTSGENFAMQRAARSTGFRIEYATIWFSKEVK